MLTCGTLLRKLQIQAQRNIYFTRFWATFTLKGYTIAVNRSILMQTRTIDDKYRPNALKNIMILHAASPAIHSMVILQNISIGTIINVTIRSAMFKCRIISSILDLRCRPRRRLTHTATFPEADSTNRMEYMMISILVSSSNSNRFSTVLFLLLDQPASVSFIAKSVELSTQICGSVILLVYH
ncbi:hypothetical protein CEXT_408751 [Caerostris extrusa]|uniref:Uncharacterized protein n=1 Tax=Caerostris extrusa TaxID=172846 RepID=A0AAV4W7E2_CAEEX|nr:hypothetical protein CEXT_408751 [Caerostris extrusa]